MAVARTPCARTTTDRSGPSSRSLLCVTQPGQPYQPNYQPQSGRPIPPQQAQGYPEPDGNYLGLQYTQPPSGQYPQQVATGHLRVNIQGSVMTSSFVPPTLLINNQVVRSSYGPNDYVLPAGQYHVSAYAQWMRRYGEAALDLVLQPGHAVEVFYAAPYNQFSSGSMGFTKQPRKGIGLLVGLLGGVMFFVLLMLVIGFMP
jgi:hypothetical protein